jgi:hypothetical protein
MRFQDRAQSGSHNVMIVGDEDSRHDRLSSGSLNRKRADARTQFQGFELA